MDFITKIQLKEVMETYSVHIKTFFVMFILILLFIIYSHSNMNQDDELTYIVYRQCWGWVFISIISLMILSFSPTYYVMIARMLLAFVIIGMADISASLPEYGVHEYSLPWLSFGYIMIIISPNFWKSNWFIFTLCFIYFALRIYFKYGYMPEKFMLTLYACIFYFVTAAVLLNSKLKRLWTAILKSEKLVEEMKKLLTIFPNGVIIHSGYSNESWTTVFSNKQFQSQILGLKTELSLFDSIEIKFRKSGKINENLISTSLKKLLKNHQKRISFIRW